MPDTRHACSMIEGRPSELQRDLPEGEASAVAGDGLFVSEEASCLVGELLSGFFAGVMDTGSNRGRGRPVSEPAQRPEAVRAAYDAVAHAYDAAFRDELDRKPLDRALLVALAELAGEGTIADLGCGPGHATRFVAERHHDIVGLDLSPAMVGIAQRHAPEGRFAVGSLLALPVRDQVWSGVLALYSIIHLTSDQRRVAARELARVLRPGGPALVAFHIEGADTPAGQTRHLTDWFGEPVDLHGFFLDPDTVRADLESAGLRVSAVIEREAIPDVEFPSRRCYMLAATPTRSA